jgi:hypothetical protein
VKTDTTSAFRRVFKQLKEHGFLLESDPYLPSVCLIIAGEPVRGSWWSHPKAQTIFNVNELLEGHEDVLITKLISSKITFVHKQLWSELMTVGSSDSVWQSDGLTEAALILLEIILREGSLRTDKLDWPSNLKTKPGNAARLLEERLLIVSAPIHTETGAHAKRIETWQHWSERISFQPKQFEPEVAMKRVEALLDGLNKQFDGRATLPWARTSRKSAIREATR